jgi:diaminopimelate decarboxylase
MDKYTTTPAAIADQSAISWISRSDLQLIAARVGTPVYVYSEEKLLRNLNRIISAAAAAGLGDRVELFVPFFPNSNPHILRPLSKLGLGILVQLPAEHKILGQFGFDKFIISPGHISDQEIDFWSQTRCPIFLSSLDEIAYLLRTHARASVNVRLDSLSSAKPGLKFSQLKTLSDLLAAHTRELDCFEVYCGSGNSVDEMISVLEQVFMIFRTHFPRARSINFAGGYGFNYEEWNEAEKHFDWSRYLRKLREIADRYEVPNHVRFLFEPARDLLADIGTLLLSVKRNLITKPGANQVLTDGSRILLPSAQHKGRRHNVVFLDASMAEMTPNGTRAALRGRSILRHDYVLPGDYLVPDDIGPRDYVLILDVGAYCATQHMEFLNIPPAAEVLKEAAGSMFLITSHGNELDKWRHLLGEKQSLKKSRLKPRA